LANILKKIVAGTEPLASDIDQIVQLLNGVADIGALSLAQPVADPAAPILAINGAAGNLNGTYKYKLVYCTGLLDSDSNYYFSGFVAETEATVSVTNGKVDLTLPGFSAPIIATAIYRTAVGGASGTEKFISMVMNGSIFSFTGNVTDANRRTPSIPTVGILGNPISANVPTINTTGTTIDA
jgi:hypothetical protein